MTTQNTSSKSTAGKLFSGMVAAGLAASMMAPAAAFAITADETKNQPIQHERAVNNVGKTAYWLEIVEDADYSVPALSHFIVMTPKLISFHPQNLSVPSPFLLLLS